MSSKTTFVVHFGGQFQIPNPGTTLYAGGQTVSIECNAKDLWEMLERSIPLPMMSQRVYYKLPFEELSDLKLLWAGGDQFEKLCNIAQWVSVIELFLETDNSQTLEEDAEAIVPPEEAEDTVTPEEAEATDPAEATVFEEESRVEAVIAGITEDSESDGELPSTPRCSDNEEDPDEYERFKKGSAELKIRQVFNSLEEFKEGLLDYALKGGWNIKNSRWGPKRAEAVCAARGEHKCLWRIYCSYDESVDGFMVKTLYDQHTCIKDGRCKLLTDNVIAKMFKNDLRNNPDMQPKDIQAKIEEKYSIVCTYDQLKKARMKAIRLVEAEFDEQYSKIKDYEIEIRNSNPGSTVELKTVMKGSVEVFEKFYVCYKALKSAWLASSRRVIGIDGCFLKNGTKSQLLCVVGRDGNNAIYPIAWAVVQIEDEPNWNWFLSKLKEDLRLGNGNGLTLISDRQKGLLNAVAEMLPAVEHRMCARHIYGNICKYFPRRGRFKKLFWDIIQSYTTVDYEAALQKLKEYDFNVYDALMQRNPQTCSRAFFKTESTCEDALNNHSESYNNTLQKARTMPLVELFETMRRQAMVRIEMRRVKAMNHRATFCPRVSKLIKHEEEYKKYCKIFPGPTGLFEVIEKGIPFKVNMNTKTCTCRRWDLTGVPCRHSLRVIMDKKLDVEKYVAKCFLTKVWQKQYNYNINPLKGMKFWKDSGKPTLQAPPRVVKRGRSRKPQKRIKEVNEDPKGAKKVSTHCRVMHCQKCGMIGHFQNRCKNPGAMTKPSKKKLLAMMAEQEAAENAEREAAENAEREGAENAEEDYMSVGEEGGPPPTQPTQAD